MLFPSIFRDSFFDDDDDFMDFPVATGTDYLMKSDVKELDHAYELDMDLPGFNKDDVKMQLKNGVLNISASTSQNNDEKDKDGKYIRRERFQGTCQRSFYVGKELKPEDIKAQFENGVLKVTVPKKEAQPEVEENKYIQIEG
ncbi:MAG: Hsp20/alpha crystallin family protein [Eubacteriales bacterium]|nr:Hsp20/alpha crystallin family protein [Eubacteriales bacterium]